MRQSTSISGCFRWLVGRLVGRSVGLVAPYWPSWPCFTFTPLPMVQLHFSFLPQMQLLIWLLIWYINFVHWLVDGWYSKLAWKTGKWRKHRKFSSQIVFRYGAMFLEKKKTSVWLAFLELWLKKMKKENVSKISPFHHFSSLRKNTF